MLCVESDEMSHESMAGIFALAWNCMEVDGEATCIRLHDRSWRICFLAKVRACIWAVAVFTSCKAQPNQKGLEWENVYSVLAALFAYNPEALCLDLFICVFL